MSALYVVIKSGGMHDGSSRQSRNSSSDAFGDDFGYWCSSTGAANNPIPPQIKTC
jgi:hypothetical protein